MQDATTWATNEERRSGRIRVLGEGEYRCLWVWENMSVGGCGRI